uniref:ATP synthase subunit epsilon, mitochondrial n=1 Tax=Magallana gigas TaxID=29159 RepID=A0A8W8LF60_MAGGI
MSSYAWRQVGLTYIQYSNACARAVRNSLKPELKVDAMKRGNSIIKATRWEEGKPVQGKYSSAQYIEYCRFHILCEYFIPLSHHLLQNVTI